MIVSRELRKIFRDDHSLVRHIYEDAIQSQGEKFYTKEQVQAWSSLAWVPGVLDQALTNGNGWISLENKETAAFAMRYPENRLALIYCRGRFTSCGHGTALLKCIELQAFKEGEEFLITEASSFSYPFLLKRGWRLDHSERITIAGIGFTRYLMRKKLSNNEYHCDSLH